MKEDWDLEDMKVDRYRKWVVQQGLKSFCNLTGENVNPHDKIWDDWRKW